MSYYPNLRQNPTMVHTESPEEPEDTPRDLPRDDLFHLLSNQRRRHVLRYLANHEGSVEMRTLTEQVAAWEHDTTVETLSSTQRQRVYIPLYQNHLPKLAAHDIIEYDQSRGQVEATPRLFKLLPYLDDQPSPSGDTKQPTTTIPLIDAVPNSVREVTSVSAITGGLVVASRLVPTRFLTVLAMISVILLLSVRRV